MAPKKRRSPRSPDRSGASRQAQTRRSPKAPPVPRRGRALLLEREDVGFVADADLVVVGRLGRPWGVRGAINIRLHDPNDDCEWAEEVLWLRGEGFPSAAVEVERYIEKGSKLLLKFADIHSPQDVSALTHLDVLVPRARLPEPKEDEHYVQDLLGMEVVDEARGRLGTIHSVFSTGANDVWVVRDGGAEELIPAIKQVVLEVDHESRRISVSFELI